ncbi:MAG TPA: HypC/HybG/HupF family hydrogenase formation chaperone [Firmicutes bacterium]|nr:HypC/HybG/HupF family hydrogenase formation chaperone [Bacillota bacterium]
MCVAMPGKILEINDHKAKVSFNGMEMNADVRMVDAKVGDYVLVHAGCAIEVLSQSRAEEMLEIFKELEELQ